MGVIIFLLVKGTMPFLNADENDYYYSKIISGDIDTYFAEVDNSNSLSPEFRDLISKLFSYDASKRPSIAEIRAHPWLQLGENRSVEETKTCSVIANVDEYRINTKELTRFKLKEMRRSKLEAEMPSVAH